MADRVRSPRGLDLDRILEVACDIVGRDGLDALTMRSLGNELGVSGAAISWRVRSRDDLLRRIYDRTLQDLDLAVHPDASWQEQFAGYCRSVRSMMMRNPFMSELAQRFQGRGAVRVLKLLMSVAMQAGYDDAEAFRMAVLFETYAVGSSTVEISTATQSGGRLRHLLEEDEDGADVVYLLPHLMADDSEATFEFGLACLLNGLPGPAAVK